MAGIDDALRSAVVEHAAQYNNHAAADRFGVSTRSVIRWRIAAGVESGYQPPEPTQGCGTPAGYPRCPGDPSGRWKHCDVCRAGLNERTRERRRRLAAR